MGKYFGCHAINIHVFARGYRFLEGEYFEDFILLTCLKNDTMRTKIEADNYKTEIIFEKLNLFRWAHSF